MGKLVGENFLCDVLEKLFKRLGSVEFAKFFGGKKSIGEQLRKLSEQLMSASLVLNDAEERQISEPNVKEWLDELTHVVLTADDLVEDINDEARSKQMERDHQSGISRRRLKMLWMSIFRIFTEFDRHVQGEVARISNDLDDVLDKRIVLGLKTGSMVKAPKVVSLRRLMHEVEESHIYGRNAEKEEILKLLLSNDVWGNGIGVLPIVGVGGIGKTTLAELVCGDVRLKEHDFQLKAWVTVSAEFDVSRILKAILQRVNSRAPRYIEEPEELQLRLRRALIGKKFLLVLDDVWDENYENWHFLWSTFTFADKGSRIIVTTRSENVASIVKTGEVTYQLRQLPEADCWKIFAERAFSGDLDADPCLRQVGKKIVKKCWGLPLALKSLGSLLRFERDPSKWDSILWSHVWELGETQRNNILPSLWLSYHYLPSCLKQCFAYCSVFPKDFEIQKEELILLWMAEGFLQSVEEETRMEDVGEECIKDLISRSLVQRSRYDESTVKMHDLVHDLALFVSGKFCLRYGDNTHIKHLTIKTRHLSHSRYNSWTSLSEAKYLRTFIGGSHKNSADQLVEKVTENGKCLRVISQLTKNWSWSVPESFSNLKHLRYLNLSGNMFYEVPSSLCSLYNLQTLLLSNCGRLTKLPANMGRLINLRHLDTTSSPLKAMPPQMCNLKQLQKLTDFVLSVRTGPSIKELGDLRYLGGELRISWLENVDSVEDVLKANLREKANLNELSLTWRRDSTGSRRGREVLDALQPHTNLKKLSIIRYAGSFFPKWVGDASFSNIVSLNLIDCEYCLLLPPVGQLPSLRELCVQGFDGLETVGVEFCGTNSSVIPFQSLEILSFREMSNWSEWLFIGGDREVGYFPRLKQLCLYCCSNFIGSLPDCDSIETLQLNWCAKLEFPGSCGYANLRKLEIIACDALASLPLDYFPMLKELVLRYCQKLESLTFSEGSGTVLHYLSLLRVFNCENLRSLPHHMHRLLPSLAFMEMSECPNVESLPEAGLPRDLDTLVIFKCRKLIVERRNWYLHGLNALRSLCIAHSDAVLDSFPEVFLPMSLTSLKLLNLSNLRSLNGSAFQHVSSLVTLSVSHCKKLQFLPEEVLRTSLCTLIIKECPFLERRYRRWEGEDWHSISHIPNIEISGQTTNQFKNGLQDSACTHETRDEEDLQPMALHVFFSSEIAAERRSLWE